MTDAADTVRLGCLGAAIEPSTRFVIGSLDKSLVGLACERLAEQGDVDLDAPVVSLLPWCPSAEITLHHLLTHSAGLPRGQDGTPSIQLETWLALQRSPAWAPGTRFWYSNTGYRLLELALSARMQCAAARLLDPVLQTVGEKDCGTEDGRSTMSIEGLVAFMRVLLRRGAPLLGPGAFQRMTHPWIATLDGAHYGHGIVLYGDAMGHTGATAGSRSAYVVDCDAGLGAAVLSNGLVEVTAIARKLLAEARGEPVTPLEVVPHAVEAAPLSGEHPVCGRYGSHNAELPFVQVVERDRCLHLILPSGDAYPLRQIAEWQYGCGPEDVERIAFDSLLDGRPLRARLGGCDFGRMG